MEDEMVVCKDCVFWGSVYTKVYDEKFSSDFGDCEAINKTHIHLFMKKSINLYSEQLRTHKGFGCRFGERRGDE